MSRLEGSELSPGSIAKPRSAPISNANTATELRSVLIPSHSRFSIKYSNAAIPLDRYSFPQTQSDGSWPSICSQRRNGACNHPPKIIGMMSKLKTTERGAEESERNAVILQHQCGTDHQGAGPGDCAISGADGDQALSARGA